MKRPPRSFGLPLLDKELTEQAARRRTYILRGAYAAVLFVAFLVQFNRAFGRIARHAYQTLGTGRDMFEFLVGAQLIGIMAFLPGMMSPVITVEKERDSLSLLLMTDLGPWEIVIQKYLGRLIPMLSFLLLSLPLMAVAYGFGGISADYVASGVWLLLLTCFQVGAFALMMSAFCRTTAQAFVGSYVLLALVCLAPALLSLMARGFRRVDDDFAFALLTPYLFETAARKSFGVAFLRSVPVLISACVFFVLSRVFVLRRAFVKPRDLTLGLFKTLDRFMRRANRLTGGIMIVKERSGLPENDPVTWREVTKKALGKPHYLFRILVAAEVPVVCVSVMALAPLAGGRANQWSEKVLPVVAFVLWGIATLAVSVKSASSIITERSRQTLDVLLTTPLTGPQIILQKMRGVWRLIYVLWIPLFTVFLVGAFGASMRAAGGGGAAFGTFGYLASSVLAAVIYLPMFAWVAFWIGLRSRGRSRAIITMLAGVVGWCAAPFVLLAALNAVGAHVGRGGLSYLALLSPVALIGLTEYRGFGDFGDVPLVPVTLNYLWHGGVLFFFRHLCLSKADRYLGRM